MKKRFSLKSTLSAICALALVASLGGCSAATVPEGTTATVAEATPEAVPTEKANMTVLKVGASPSPHAEILQFVKEKLATQGIDLQIKEFTDYVIPNRALDSKELDANFFQHKPYLDDFNKNNGTDLVSAAAIHFEPLGIYGGKSSDLSTISDKAELTVPNDTTNEARALLLLEKQGLITLKEGVGLEATVKDIQKNPHNLKITEMEAAQLPRVLQDVDFAVINGNYAVGAGISDSVLVTEDKDSAAAKQFANIIAVRSGDETREDILALIAALQSDEVKTFLAEKYNATVIPVL